MPPTRVAAIRVLGPKATQFSQDVSHFPGVTGADHRKALVIALDDLTEILQLINGPEKSPELVNSLATIAEARQVAEMQSIPYPRMVGTENQALSAIDSALTEMTTRFLIDKDQLPALLETLKAKVATAAASEGSMHDLDAGYAFQAADSVVQQITTDLQAMIHDLPDQDRASDTSPGAPRTRVADAAGDNTAARIRADHRSRADARGNTPLRSIGLITKKPVLRYAEEPGSVTGCCHHPIRFVGISQNRLFAFQHCVPQPTKGSGFILHRPKQLTAPRS